MTRVVPQLREDVPCRRIRSSILPLVLGIMFLCCISGTASAKKAERTLTTADGKPIRKVYVDAGTPVMANSATTRLTQDTCLTVVASPKTADAILEVGIPLPSIGGDSGGSDPFGSQPKAQTLGNAHGRRKRSASATCSDGKGGTMSCSSAYSQQGGEAPEQPAVDWTQGITPTYTVSLASSEDSTQDLWDPNGREKHASWSDQLREAAGCPVCPGESFNPRRDKMTYRQWMQANCPNVLNAAAE